MPRSPRIKTAERPAPTAIVASAANVTNASREGRRVPKTTEWQREAWYFYDTIGELRFGANWLGNALSRTTLRVEVDGVPQEDGPAVDALDVLFGGPTGQGQMLSAFGVHLTVAGEAYLVGKVKPGEGEEGDEDDEWAVMSTEEIKQSGNSKSKWTIDRGDGKKETLDGNEGLVIRLWRSHPRKYVEADSPTRAVIPILREIEQLTKHVAATIDSRLAGAGILLLPSEMSFTSPTPDDESGDHLDDDPFMRGLTEAMTIPIQDRGSASAVVPLVIKAPGAVLANATHLKFSTPFDEATQELRTEAIRRLALGMDLPPEIMLGTAGINHWGAWQVDEAAIKMHVEPLLELIVDALTKWYLVPALEGMGEDPSGVSIGFDTSDLRLRPNRATQAIELYDRLELSGETLRRETGFEESDAPDAEEIKSILLRKMAIGVSTSDLTVAALHELGMPLVPIPSQVPVKPEDKGLTPRGPQPDPVAPAVEQPDTVREPPAIGAAANTEFDGVAIDLGLFAAAEMLLLRALERANNKVNRRGRTRRSFTNEECDQGLADAWVHIPRVAGYTGIDPERLECALDRCARDALRGGEYNAGLLVAALRDVRPQMRVVASG